MHRRFSDGVWKLLLFEVTEQPAASCARHVFHDYDSCCFSKSRKKPASSCPRQFFPWLWTTAANKCHGRTTARGMFFHDLKKYQLSNVIELPAARFSMTFRSCYFSKSWKHLPRAAHGRFFHDMWYLSLFKVTEKPVASYPRQVFPWLWFRLFRPSLVRFFPKAVARVLS